MRKSSTELLEQGTQTPSPAPDLIPAETKNSTEDSHSDWYSKRGHLNSIDDFRQNSLGYSRSRHDRWNLLLFRSFSHDPGRVLAFVEHGYL